MHNISYRASLLSILRSQPDIPIKKQAEEVLHELLQVKYNYELKGRNIGIAEKAKETRSGML